MRFLDLKASLSSETEDLVLVGRLSDLEKGL